MVVNELQMFIWKKTILGGKINLHDYYFWNPPKNDYDTDLWKYGPFQIIQKFVTFSWLNVF
jgi:hypothetical protein